MCGRFTLLTDIEQIRQSFHINEVHYDLQARTNIAPGQNIAVIHQQKEERVLDGFRWGLIPSWAKEAKIGYKMINARAETLSTKASFRSLIARHRVVILANGYYEWKKDGKEKQPYRFQLQSREPFAFAGLYDEWESPEDGERVRSCTIITTEPNAMAAEVHNRMPVILTNKALDSWLDPEVTNKDQLQELLTAYPADQMIKYPVSKNVGNVANHNPELIEEVPLNSK